ncbi:16530_t:CDS:2 [Racocetra persica]|uniref:16530_t:CDS:1 n=1 Tax=Racocetra persica TaxID=160502 RepID=A0ACA9LAB0_9GLOM|nr:16530_t:CDS:2 [Racocetra persica]
MNSLDPNLLTQTLHNFFTHNAHLLPNYIPDSRKKYLSSYRVDKNGTAYWKFREVERDEEPEPQLNPSLSEATVKTNPVPTPPNLNPQPLNTNPIQSFIPDPTNLDPQIPPLTIPTTLPQLASNLKTLAPTNNETTQLITYTLIATAVRLKTAFETKSAEYKALLQEHLTRSKKHYQSVFDKEFHLDKKTKGAFADFIKKAKKRKFDPSKHSGTIICGPEEFTATKKKSPKSKNLFGAGEYRSGSIKFGGFCPSYNWYGKTNLSFDKVGIIDWPKYDFPQFVNTMAHEITHCLLADYDPREAGEHDKQQKLTGLFLHKDVDYRTLLADMSNQYGEENLPDQEYLVEEIALEYCRMVVKSLIESQ